MLQAIDQVHKHTHTHTFIPWILKFVMSTVGCGICHKDSNIKINAKRTKQKQHRHNTTQYNTVTLCIKKFTAVI